MRATDKLPGDFVSNGQPNFDINKVENIINVVNSGSSAMQRSLSSNHKNNGKTICVIATDPGTQTVGVVCNETAFAYGGSKEADYDGVAGIPGEDPPANCFPELEELTENRWGWSNGLLSEGSYEYPLYAGSGQCILSKGFLIGYADIEYSSGTANVTFRSINGIKLPDTHLYVGSTILPPNGKVSPGKYPNNNDIVSQSDTEVSYEVTGLSGDIYVIAHSGG